MIQGKLSILISFLFVLTFLQMTAAQNNSGTYVVYVGNQVVAEENFIREKLSDGRIKTVSTISTNSLTTITRNNKPVEFWIEAGGAKLLTTTFTDGTAKTLISGQPEKSVKADPVVVLENGVWSQFTDLLAQYDAGKGGVQNFTAFLPSQSMALPLTLEKIDTKDLKTGGQTVSLSHYRLVHTGSNLLIQILSDENGFPLFIEIPAQEVKVVKKGFEELLKTKNDFNASAGSFSGEFTSEEVVFQNGEISLAGTLTLPKTDRKRFPAFIIISGSGSQDRDGSQLLNLYRHIAENLSKAGMAVLRVDDRGTGKSTILKEKAGETSYGDIISDSAAAFKYLTTRPEIEKDRIGLLGHSEGALTALKMASEDQKIAAIVLLSGASRPLDQIVAEQELYQRAWQETTDASDKSKIMPVAQNLLKRFADARLPENSNNPRLNWFREHLAIDPRRLAAQVKCPVLIVQGERDVLVLAYHAIELTNALTTSGNKNTSLRILPNLTHIFTPINANREEAVKVSDDLMRTLQTWASATLGK